MGVRGMTEANAQLVFHSASHVGAANRARAIINFPVGGRKARIVSRAARFASSARAFAPKETQFSCRQRINWLDYRGEKNIDGSLGYYKCLGGDRANPEHS